MKKKVKSFAPLAISAAALYFVTTSDCHGEFVWWRVGVVDWVERGEFGAVFVEIEREQSFGDRDSMKIDGRGGGGGTEDEDEIETSLSVHRSLPPISSSSRRLDAHWRGRARCQRRWNCCRSSWRRSVARVYLFTVGGFVECGFVDCSFVSTTERKKVTLTLSSSSLPLLKKKSFTVFSSLVRASEKSLRLSRHCRPLMTLWVLCQVRRWRPVDSRIK